MSRRLRVARDEREEWLAAVTLAHLAADGSRVPLSLLGSHSSAEIVGASPATLRRWRRASLQPESSSRGPEGWARTFVDRVRTFDVSEAEAALNRSGAEFVPYSSDLFPPPLRQLAEPPAGLFVAGSKERALTLLQAPTATVVGARRATPYAMAATDLIARALAGAGITVVSGLAFGVDVSAHRGCLSVGGGTVAVLAAGPDRAYPRRHACVHARIVRRGAVVSEVPPGVPLLPWRFLLRNRLLAALGDAVVVTEAGERSGALNTVEWALGLGRTVFAVPGQILSTSAIGVNRLLHAGATPCVDPDGLVEDFLFATRMDRQARKAEMPRTAVADEEVRSHRGDGVPCSKGAEESLVVLALSRGPSTVDDLSRSVGLSAREVSVALALLEARGRTRRIGQGRYVLL